jgi:hypothetical protein
LGRKRRFTLLLASEEIKMNNITKLKTYYVVMMHRFGDIQKYSYINGIYDNLKLAKSNGKSEKVNRGNKYYPAIYEYHLNSEIVISIEYLDFETNKWKVRYKS